MNFQHLKQYQFERRLYGPLKVGDVCIWQNLVGTASRLNGTETTIVEIITVPGIRCPYLTDTPIDEGRCCAEHHELRKKVLPAREVDTVLDWAECSWKPRNEGGGDGPAAVPGETSTAEGK